MTSCEEVLERAAKDGSIDPADWARLFDTILSRLEQTVHKAFIIPSIPEPAAPPTAAAHPSSPSKDPTSDPSSTDPSPSQTAHKENVTDSSPPPPASQPASAPHATNIAHYSDFVLPGPLLATWTYVRTTLTKQFSSYPPHTIQRLSELILRPRQHYRFLPAYLNALDRVVSVSSGSSSFPLPSVELPSASGPSGTLVNGATTTTASLSPSSSMDSDDSLGGALLTPIPWLRNGSGSGYSSPQRQANGDTDGPQRTDGDGDATMAAAENATRGTGAVTQGELLRQEQEASEPPAPVATAENRAHAGAATAGADGDGQERRAEGDGSDLPHARGPERIGLEDTGLRPHDAGPGIGHALNMEAAVGRAQAGRGSTPETHTGDITTSEAVPDGSQDDTAKRDSDGDVEITDVDGITEEEKRDADIAGDGTAPDTVDATAR